MELFQGFCCIMASVITSLVALAVLIYGTITLLALAMKVILMAIDSKLFNWIMDAPSKYWGWLQKVLRMWY